MVGKRDSSRVFVLEGKLTGRGMHGVAGLLTKAIDLVKYGLWGIL